METNTLQGTSRIVASKDQVSCDLAGEAAILNLQSGIYFGLNPVGARIWNLIEEPTTLDVLRTTIMKEYEVEEAKCEADIRSLITQLLEHGLVEIIE
jgi:hypothetical protein